MTTPEEDADAPPAPPPAARRRLRALIGLAAVLPAAAHRRGRARRAVAGDPGAPGLGLREPVFDIFHRSLLQGGGDASRRARERPPRS